MCVCNNTRTHTHTHTDVMVSQDGLLNTRSMMTSWLREYTCNQNFKRGGRETGDRRERERGERERERERERETERERVNVYREENREKGEGERDGRRHDSGTQRTSNVL